VSVEDDRPVSSADVGCNRHIRQMVLAECLVAFLQNHHRWTCSVQ
jgi:hypothetical protein